MLYSFINKNESDKQVLINLKIEKKNLKNRHKYDFLES